MGISNYQFFCNIDILREWSYSVTPENSTRPNRDVVNKLRNYKEIPSEASLEDIINSLKSNGNKNIDKVKDLKINIYELTRDVNTAKDSVISSNGKKIFNLLLPTNEEEYKIANQYFLCCESRLFSDEEKLCEYLKFKDSHSQIKTYYYLPGRAVTLQQIYRFGIEYSYVKRGIDKGLKSLEKNGIVEAISECPGLYKLSFEGCKKFLGNIS